MFYAIDKRESNRITCLRAICVLFVVFLHQYAGALGETGFVASGTVVSNPLLESIQYIVSRIITFSAVPLFFLMSSVLLYAKEFTWKSNMRKKLKSLVIPYLLWISLYILFYYIGQTIPATSSYFANAGRYVKAMGGGDFIGAYTGIGGKGLFVNALWFLRDLIILNLFAPCIKTVIDRAPGITFVLIMILWNIGHIPDFLILNTQSVVFFFLGYYVVKYGKRMSDLDKCSIAGLSIIYILLVAIEYFFYSTEDSLRIAAHSFSVVIGILILIKISGYICKSSTDNVPKVIAVLAEFSFFVYCSSDLIQTIMKKMSTKVLPSDDCIQFIAYIIIPFAVCIVCTFTGVVLQKLIPLAYNILTGSRKK